jgi:hypothetical protein
VFDKWTTKIAPLATPHNHLKKYVVDLTAEERASLQQLLQAFAAEDHTDEEIVSALRVGRSTVERTGGLVKRCVNEHQAAILSCDA